VNLHKQVKQIFAAASGLQGAERVAYLEQVCENDSQLLREVESLLKFDTSQTIIEPREELSFDENEVRAIAPAGTRNQPTRYAVVTGWVTWLFGPRRRRFLIAAVALVVFTSLSWWVYASLNHSLREIREAEVKTILHADITAMRLWIAEMLAETEMWGRQKTISAAATTLAAAAHRGERPTDQNSLEPAEAIHHFLEPFLSRTGSVGYVLSDRNGIVLSTSDNKHKKERLSETAFEQTGRIFEGHAVFTRPHPAVLFSHGVGSSGQPLVWTSAPVRDSAGKVVARLALSRFANHHFSKILTVARMGGSGETYAFDERGVMLSESRFTPQLRKAGVLKQRQSSVFNVQVRDPGADLTAGGELPAKLNAQPLTLMAASAVTGENGLNLNGYRDYRGVQVIGAWEWLPEYGFGVASEVDRSEAFAPLGYLQFGYGLLLATLGVAVIGWLLSMVRIATMKRGGAGQAPVGQYTLEEKIGEGGMGVVYRAEHAMLQRPTAVKLLSKVSTASVARFEQEVQMACKLSHPNTIQIFDYGHTPDNRFYYAMELIEGLSLAEFARIEGQIPAIRVVHIIRQICLSLREAHVLGMIHRDIKPHNIMLCNRGGEADVVKVLDFGLVRNIDAPETREIRAGAGISGTPMYMSPERFSNPRDVDARCDIYAVGAVAFRLLTGETLFKPAGFNELVYQIINAEPPAASELANSDISPALDQFVSSCLAKDISCRPASMVQLLQDLDQLPEAFQWTPQAAQTWWRSRFPSGAPQAPRKATAAVADTRGAHSVEHPTLDSQEVL